MRIRQILLSILLLVIATGAWAQMFQNRNLYDVWITAEAFLDAGKFDKAIVLYQGVPNVPQFQNRLKTAKSLKVLFESAERLYQSKKYDQALEMFSKYREIDRDLHVPVFDDRIQSCLRQIDRGLVKKLNESTRVVAGFEWAYKGEQQLSDLDTVAARRSFAKAAQLGGNLNATLREQYKEGQQAVGNLTAWGKGYRQALAANNKEKALDLLRQYRSASKYIINSLEFEIRNKEEQLAQIGTGGFSDAQVNAYARECRVEELFYYLKNNSQARTGADSTARIVQEYQRIAGDIILLRKDPGNREFLESAFKSLIVKGSQVPEVGKLVQECAKRSYYDYLLNLALLNEKAGDDTGEVGKYREAAGFMVEARQLGLSQYEAEIDEIQRRLSGKTGCEGTLRQFARAIISIKREIANCRIQQSKKIWEESLARLSGCGLNTPVFLNQYATLRDSINRLYAADSLYFLLEGRATRAIAANRCEEASQLFQRMAVLELCDGNYQDSASVANLKKLANCERINCYVANRDKAVASVNDKEWERAYVYYQAASECATPAQNERITAILNSIECDAYPERCRKNKVSLQPTARILTNKPKYTEDGTVRETSYGYFTSGGLQVSFLSLETPLDLVLGAEYFRTQYQSLRSDQSSQGASGQFDISGANAYVALKLHKPRIEPDRLRPYLKVGAELLLPFTYNHANYDNIFESTNDRSLLKKQSLMASGAVGIEVERKSFGFFAELTTAYDFSGIYNANAVTASGARGITEAYFRGVGVRLGVRFW